MSDAPAVSSRAAKISEIATQSRGREPALSAHQALTHSSASRRMVASSSTAASSRSTQAHACGSEWRSARAALCDRDCLRFARTALRVRYCRLLAPALLALSLLAAIAAAQDEGKILRPVDGAALSTETLDIIATAPGGRLQLDGKPVEARQPFPNVFHAGVQASPGEHRLALLWEGGRKEIRFHVGTNPPAEFKTFQQHPPLAAVECTQCHGVSRRGRFRFEGGCFACHAEDNFTKTHPHAVHVLQECGLCHNAHGSTEKGLLLYPKEKACKLCHG